MTTSDDTIPTSVSPGPSNLSSSGTAPEISIVLCTHNRADYLQTALSSLFEQQASRATWELILVDNRSSDATPEIGAALAERGLLRYLHEPELGLCHARNTGWRNARGPYVAYFDDDAIAEPDWIDAVAEAFAFDPKPGIVGGRVEPIWQAPRPPWLSDEIARSLTILDWSPEPKYIEDARREWLVGANMAIPRTILEEVGGFEPRLDRTGTSLLTGGDVWLQTQIMARGHPCLYQPAMRIRHLVAEARLDKTWFERRYYWQGISDAVATLLSERLDRGERLSRAMSSLRTLLADPAQLHRLLRRSDDPEAFQKRCLGLIRVGYIAGLLGKAKI